MATNIVENRSFIIETLKREVMQDLSGLMLDLEANDFFKSPASTKHHGSFPGGLAEHSIFVYNLLRERAKQHGLNFLESTLAICGLLHDVCKAGCYRPGFKNQKIGGVWQQVPLWEFCDSFPCGHGEKSIIQLQRFIVLTDEEIMAIRWHMGAWDPGVMQYPNSAQYDEAKKRTPLVILLHTADLEASQIIESCETSVR